MKKVIALVLSLVLFLAVFTAPAMAEEDVYAEFVFAWAGDFCRITNYTDEEGEVIFVEPESVVSETAAEEASEYHMTWDEEEESFVLDALRADGSMCSRSWYSTAMWAATLERMMQSARSDFRVTGWTSTQGNFVVSLGVDGQRRSQVILAEYFEGGTREEYRLEEVVNYLNSSFPMYDWTCYGKISHWDEDVRFDILVPEFELFFFIEAHVDEEGEVVAYYEDMYAALELLESNAQFEE